MTDWTRNGWSCVGVRCTARTAGCLMDQERRLSKQDLHGGRLSHSVLSIELVRERASGTSTYTRGCRFGLITVGGVLAIPRPSDKTGSSWLPGRDSDGVALSCGKMRPACSTVLSWSGVCVAARLRLTARDCYGNTHTVHKQSTQVDNGSKPSPNTVTQTARKTHLNTVMRGDVVVSNGGFRLIVPDKEDGTQHSLLWVLRAH